MEKVNFLLRDQLVHEEHFGICDGHSAGEPAYVSRDIADRSSWGACVRKCSLLPVCFVPVDNYIEVRRPDGNMENRCDALLHNEEYVIYVELKDQARDWIGHAVEDQLRATINAFRQMHDISSFRHKVAYVCNRQHRHFQVSEKGRMQGFRNETGVRLLLTYDICIG